MPNTTNYGFTYESPGSLPGTTLTGGKTGGSPILAVEVDNVIANIDATLAGVDVRLTTAESDITALENIVSNDTGWISLSVSPAGGYSLTTALYRHWGPVVSILIHLERTGGNFIANSQGGVTDTVMCTIDTIAARPSQGTPSTVRTSATSGTATINATGSIIIADMHSDSVITTGDVVQIAHTYFSSTLP